MGIFQHRSQYSSVSIAKKRLKTLLISDRVECRPDTYELMCNELYRTISKYVKTEKDFFDVEVTRSKILITLIGEKS